MASKVEEARARLVKKIRDANRARREAEARKQGCEHEWQPFRESITPDNPVFMGSALFRVLGCPKCKAKSYLELVVHLA